MKNVNASRFRDTEPEAYEAIWENHYVDDYLDSASTEEDLIRRVNTVIRVHDAGSFQIRNWASSSTEVLKSIPSHLCALTDEQLTG